jgi:predicted  nucleic acid-binding Zn-ribbon protein
VPESPYADALRELEELERQLSRDRTRLQQRIDFVRAGTGMSDATADDQLRRLEQRERDLSDRRRALHRQLDAARAARKAK